MPLATATPLPSRLKAGVPAVIFLLVGVWICLEAVQVPVGSLRMPGAGFFPLVLGGLLCFLALALGLTTLYNPGVSPPRVLPEQTEVYALIGAMLISVWLFERAGFLPTMTLFLIIVLKTLGKLTWLGTIIVAIVASLAAYMLFGQVLMIALPTGILSW